MRAALGARPVTGPKPDSNAAVEGDATPRLWLARLRLSEFRSYASLALDLDARTVVLTGDNGAGKTNLLEAVSLLAPGRGLRGAAFAEVVRNQAAAGSGWAVAARVHGIAGPVEIGAGATGSGDGSRRRVRINGAPARGAAALGEHVRLVWLTPALDRLFVGSGGERRRFLDRLIQGLDPGYRDSLARFERAMRQRNRLLEQDVAAASEYEGLEVQMAESGVAFAAARVQTLRALGAEIEAGREADAEPIFPWATLALEGTLEAMLEDRPAVDAEDAYRDMLERGRARDRSARRTLDGPHRADLLVGHGPKGEPARLCSTGEQKALLIGLVLAHARLVKRRTGGLAPILLLDEIAAHLDEAHRTGLFAEILALGGQAWLTGTDAALFAPLGANAQFLTVENGGVRT